MELGRNSQVEDRVKVFQFWKKRTKKEPDGVFLVQINDKIIHKDINAYCQEYANGKRFSNPNPFFSSRALPIPGSIWGKSPVESMRKIQISYNYIYSVLMMTLERMGKMKWLIPKQAKLDKKHFDSNIGEVLYYQAYPDIPPPRETPLAPIPHYFFQILQWLDKAFEDASGFHEVKHARLPTGANNPSGVMVNLLLEQDETRMAPTSKEYLRTIRNQAKLYLEMVQFLYDENRLLVISGEEKDYEIIDFKGADLRENHDVRVEMKPVLSESRAAYEQTVFNALDRQIIDPRTALKKLKLEHPKTLEDFLSQERKAIRENNELRHGMPTKIDEWHVDQIHLAIHEGFMLTKQFENLNPMKKQAFATHREEHFNRYQEKMKQQMMLQQQQQTPQQ